MGAIVTLEGVPVTQAVVSIPRVGVWHAQLALAQLEAIQATQATLRFGPKLSLTGAVRRNGSADGAGLLMLLGGSGNLGRLAVPKAYSQAPMRIPLSDLLQVAGQDLSTDSHQELLATHLTNWVVGEVPVAIALAELFREVGASWRVLPDGTLWVGTEAWPESPAFDFVATSERPLDDAVQLHSTEPAILPGQTFRGRRVSYVEHLLQEDELQTTVYLEAA